MGAVRLRECVNGSRRHKARWDPGLAGRTNSAHFQGMSSSECPGGPGLGLASGVKCPMSLHTRTHTCSGTHRDPVECRGLRCRRGDLVLLLPVQVPGAALSLFGRCPSLTEGQSRGGRAHLLLW